MSEPGGSEELVKSAPGPRRRRFLWSLAAVAAVMLVWLGLSRLPVEGEGTPEADDFLSGQVCSSFEADFAVAEGDLQLVGWWSGRVRLNGGELRVVLHRDVAIESAFVAGATYGETGDSLRGVFSAQPDHRRLRQVASGRVEERAMAAAEPPKATADDQGFSPVELRLRGPASAVSGMVEAGSLPLILRGRRGFLPRLSAVDPPGSLKFTIPAGWNACSDLPVERGPPAPGEPTLLRWQVPEGGPPSLVLGPLEERAIGELGGQQLSVVSPLGLKVAEALAQRAAAQVDEVLSPELSAPVTLVVSPHMRQGRPVQLGRTLWASAVPDGAPQWSRALATLALPGSSLPENPRFECVPEVLALLAIPRPQAAVYWRLRRQFREERGGSDPELEGWVALQRLHPERERFVRRALTAAVQGSLDLLQEDTAERLRSWASDRGGLDFSLGEVSVVRRRTGQYDATLEIRLNRGSPRLDLDLEIPVLFVGRDLVRPAKAPLGRGDSRRLRFKEELSAEPDRVILDPFELFPDARRVNNTRVLRSEATAFAVEPDSGQLALALRSGGTPSQESFGVLLDQGPEQSFAPWYRLPAPAASLSWAGRGRGLFLRFAGGEAQSGFLELESGRLRHLGEQTALGGEGRFILENEVRVTGRYRHSLYELENRRVRPFANREYAALQWIEGADEVLVSASPGESRVMDADGRVKLTLPVGSRSARCLQKNGLGYSYAVESAEGSRVFLVEVAHGREVEFPLQPQVATSVLDAPLKGRILDTFFSVETGFFYLLVQSPDGTYSSHRAHRSQGFKQQTVELKGGRPLLGVHSTKGVVLAAPLLANRLSADPMVQRLRFLPFDSGVRTAESPYFDLCEEAYLDPPPLLSSAGRYLYYFRPVSGLPDVPGDTRTRALHRYDFLSEREDPLILPE